MRQLFTGNKTCNIRLIIKTIAKLSLSKSLKHTVVTMTLEFHFNLDLELSLAQSSPYHYHLVFPSSHSIFTYVTPFFPEVVFRTSPISACCCKSSNKFFQRNFFYWISSKDFFREKDSLARCGKRKEGRKKRWRRKGQNRFRVGLPKTVRKIFDLDR